MLHFSHCLNQSDTNFVFSKASFHILWFFSILFSCFCFMDYFSKLKFCFYRYSCWGVMVLACQCVWGWEGNVQKLVLRLTGQHLHSLCHLPSPRTHLSCFLKYQHGVTDSVSPVCSSMNKMYILFYWTRFAMPYKFW